MVKIAFASDFHLGNVYANKKQTEEHSYKALEKLKNKLIDYKPDLLIIGGDIFDQNKIDGKALDVFLSFVEELNANGIGIVTISGNHDGKYWLKENFDYSIPFMLYKDRLRR